MNNLKKIRIIFWSILAIIVGWILYMGIVPSGKITYGYDFKRPGFFLGPLRPLERASQTGKHTVKISGDPAYMTLRTPRKFDQARLTIEYRDINADCATCTKSQIIEAGALVDQYAWSYDLQPVENGVLDDLKNKWLFLEKDGILLMQKNQKYSSIERFLANLPPTEKIATYNFGLQSDYTLPNYVALKQEQIMNRALRGAYQFYTYIRNENLDFVFKFSDLNKNKDQDPIELNVYFQGEKLKSLNLSDDGNTTDDNKESSVREMKLWMQNLPEGAYKIELKANDDIITQSIKTKQSKLAFIHNLWLHKTGRNENGIRMITDSRELNAKTTYPDSLQAIRLGKDQELRIVETYKQFSAKIIKRPIAEIELAKDGVILAGDGLFSFEQGNFFDPVIKKIDRNFDAEKEGIEYVIASYTPPADQGRFKTAVLDIDLTRAYREDYKYSLMISIPGLKADDNIDDGIEIANIKVELTGKNIWEFMVNRRDKW
jgi:hypothetical protein